MGWSFEMRARPKSEFIERLLNGWSTGYAGVAHRTVGNRVWQLVQAPDGHRFIALHMIAKERGGGWGNKTITEEMGPAELDCPLSLLEQASPPKNGCYAAEWRVKVREYHEKKKARAATITAGAIVSYGQHQYRLVEPAGPRRGWIVNRVSDGARFRMNARQLGEARA